MQSRRYSFIESCTNVLSGMLIAFTISQLAVELTPQIQKWLWAGFEWHVSAGSNAAMTGVLTIVSVIRGYTWRRFFNKKTINGS